jgi:hypothetical protein
MPILPYLPPSPGFCGFPVIWGGGGKYQKCHKPLHLAVIKRVIDFVPVLATYHLPVKTPCQI